MNKSILRNCTFILLLLACAQYAALAATLEGTVLDPSGKPVPGARISLLRSLTVIEERQADARGVYKFEGLQEGPYQLAASARGLACPAMNIQVRKDGNQRQDVNLALSALESQVVVSASLGGALAPQIGSSVSLVSKQDIDDRERAERTGGYSRHSGHRGQPVRQARRSDRSLYPRRRKQVQRRNGGRHPVKRVRRFL